MRRRTVKTPFGKSKQMPVFDIAGRAVAKPQVCGAQETGSKSDNLPNKEAGLGRPPPLNPSHALFVDVDGTLLDIAIHPGAVRVPPNLPGFLQSLEVRHGGAFALVSGRPIASLDQLFRPWRGAAAGVHGGERRRRDGSRADLDPGIAAAALDRIRAAAIDLAASNPGLRIEDKGRSVALHYRSAPAAGPRVERFAAQAVAEAGAVLRAIAGKMAIEFVPRGYGKGGAIAAFLAEPPFHGRRPVFLGDDVTDEEGFAEVARRGGISIKVGPPDRPTAAAYRLSDVSAVHAWLAGQPAG